MSYYSLKDCFIYASGYDVTGGDAIETVGAKMTSAIDEWRPAGNTFMTRAATGNREATISLAGLYETTTTALMAAIPDGTARVWVAGFETDALNKRFWGLRSAYVSEGEIVLADEKLDRVAPVLLASGKAHEGYIVAPLTERTTAGNTQSTYADMGSSASSVATAFLIVTSLTLGGYTSLTITPQSSANHIAWNDETAFTVVTTTGGWAIDLSGDVDQYLAMKWAWNGAGSGQKFTGFMGVSRD